MMRVGLHDNTFRGDASSAHGATPSNLEYVRDLREFDGVSLFTDGFTTDAEAATRDGTCSKVKIGWLHEPPCLIPTVYAAAPDNRQHFDFMLTYDADLLRLPGFEFMPYGGVWIEPEYRYIWRKTALCSMLIGAKDATEGHRLRPKVADAVDFLGVDYYGVRGIPVDYGASAKRKVLGRYAFSIVGECCRADNLFTEILLDCFVVGTVPVFWGCPNVGEYFDARGILSFETPDECAAIVRELSRDLYTSLRPFVEDNFHAAAQYAVPEDYLYDHYLSAYAGE